MLCNYIVTNYTYIFLYVYMIRKGWHWDRGVGNTPRKVATLSDRNTRMNCTEMNVVL